MKIIDDPFLLAKLNDDAGFDAEWGSDGTDAILVVRHPDQNAVDEFGEVFGLRYDPGEPLHCGEKEFERDRHRWELDPASAEDYIERSRPASVAWRWRHFQH